MQITFTLTPEEQPRSVNAWMKGDASASPTNTLVGPLVGIALLVSFLALLAYQASTYPPAMGEVKSGLPGMTIALMVGLVFFLFVNRPTRRNPTSPTTLSIDETSLAIMLSDRSTTVPWDDVIDIRWNNIAIIILTENNLDHVIPRRAFESSNHARAYYDQAVDYWKHPSADTPVSTFVDESAWPPPPCTGPS